VVKSDKNDFGDACDACNVVNSLIQSEEHIYVEKPQGGIIMTSPSGTCFLIYVSDTGLVSSLEVDCP